MYLSAKAIAEMPGQKKTHFLNDNAVRLNKSLGDAVGLKNIGVHIITVQPGHLSTEFHVHLFDPTLTLPRHIFHCLPATVRVSGRQVAKTLDTWIVAFRRP